MKRVILLLTLGLLLCGCSKTCQHTNTTVSGAVEATCLTAGYSGDTLCTDCNAVLSQGTVLPAPDHDWQYEGWVEATCTQPGNSGVKKCARCGSISGTAAEIAPLGHAPELKNALQATCRESGYSGDEVCRYCGLLLSSGKVIPAGTHVPETKNAVDATCTTDGYSGDSYCSVCGLLLAQGKTLAKGHTPETKNAKAATCQSEGYSGDSVCSRCGVSLSTGTMLPKTDHTPAPTQDTPATCTTPGIKGAQSCSVCGIQLADAAQIPATGHQHTQVRNAVGATATSAGYSGDTYCTDCGALLEQGYVIEAVPETTAAAVSADAVEAMLFRQVNNVRTAAGLTALQWDSALYAAALLRAKEHAANYADGMQRDAHTRPDGSSFYTALPETGISIDNISCGENLALSNDASVICQAWVDSPSHYSAIVDGEYTSAVIAVVQQNGYYFVCNLFRG